MQKFISNTQHPSSSQTTFFREINMHDYGISVQSTCCEFLSLLAQQCLVVPFLLQSDIFVKCQSTGPRFPTFVQKVPEPDLLLISDRDYIESVCSISCFSFQSVTRFFEKSHDKQGISTLCLRRGSSINQLLV